MRELIKWFDPVTALLFWAYIATNLLCLVVIIKLAKLVVWAWFQMKKVMKRIYYMLGKVEGVSEEELIIYRTALDRSSSYEYGITRKNDARLSNMLENDRIYAMWEKIFNKRTKK